MNSNVYFIIIVLLLSFVLASWFIEGSLLLPIDIAEAGVPASDQAVDLEEELGYLQFRGYFLVSGSTRIHVVATPL